MRTNEERIAALHARAEEIEHSQRSGRVRLAQSVSAFGALAAAVILALFVSKVPAVETSPGVSPEGLQGLRGSMLAGSGSLGYIVVAIIAFLLGTCVTVFCFRLKERQLEKGGVWESEKTDVRQPGADGTQE